MKKLGLLAIAALTFTVISCKNEGAKTETPSNTDTAAVITDTIIEIDEQVDTTSAKVDTVKVATGEVAK